MNKPKIELVLNLDDKNFESIIGVVSYRDNIFFATERKLYSVSNPENPELMLLKIVKDLDYGWEVII